MKVNIEQFTMNSYYKDFLWNIKKQHLFSYIVNRIQWYLYPKFHYVSNFPIHVDIEISGICNMHCPFCYRYKIEKKESLKLMDFNLYKKIIDECAKNNLYSIRLSWRGEVLLHKDLAKMVLYAKKKGIKEVSFLTNGLKLEGELALKLIKYKLDYMNISFDGMGKKYEKNRAPAKFKESVLRIRNFIKLRNKKKTFFPLVKINTIWEEIKDYPKQYKKLWYNYVDKIDLNPFMDYSVDEFDQENFECHHLWQRVVIASNGDVAMCIGDYKLLKVLGNMNKNSIKEIWNSKTMNEIRKSHIERNRLVNEPCKICHRSGNTNQIGNKRI